MLLLYLLVLYFIRRRLTEKKHQRKQKRKCPVCKDSESVEVTAEDNTKQLIKCWQCNEKKRVHLDQYITDAN